MRPSPMAVLIGFVASIGAAASHTSLAAELPPWGAVMGVSADHFASLPDFRKGDLLSQDLVAPLFSRFEAELGWKPAEKASILAEIPSESDSLVRHLRDAQGAEFMRKVSGIDGVYDRLDRIVAESGGEALLRGLVKLPGGEVYAAKKPKPGVPSLVDLLPRKGSGKTRRVVDYDKPTGRIYTADEFMMRLKEAYAKEAKASPPPAR